VDSATSGDDRSLQDLGDGIDVMAAWAHASQTVSLRRLFCSSAVANQAVFSAAWRVLKFGGKPTVIFANKTRSLDILSYIG
jgi:hypothetical protein